MIKKKWMVVTKGSNHILLHYNHELDQYKKLPRVPNEIITSLKQLKKQDEFQEIVSEKLRKIKDGK